MGESLTDEQRATLKAGVLARLRELEADLDRSEEIHGYEKRGHTHMVAPLHHESFNRALQDLQRAGEDIPDWSIRSAPLIRWSPVKGAPVEDMSDLELTEDMVAAAMAKAETRVCVPGDNRCYAFPDPLDEARRSCTETGQ